LIDFYFNYWNNHLYDYSITTQKTTIRYFTAMNTRFYITEDIQFLVYLLFLYTVSHSIVYFCGPPNSNFTLVMVSNTGIYLETIKLIVFIFYSEMSE
jgi:hypothetical protein